MAYHHPPPHRHHQNHHSSTTSFCYCQPPPPPPPPCHHSPPLPTTTTTTTDPYLLATIITQQLLQSKPHTQRDPLHHHHHPHSPILLSLLERIDAIEASLKSFSCGGPSSYSPLRDAAARTIQTRFRAHLVCRSRTLGQLQDLAFIKSSLSSLKSSLSSHAFVDFDFLSTHAMDLLLKLDSIQSGNKMIKDSKRSVTKEIVEFLDLVDGVCVNRHQVLTRKVKNSRLVKNDNRGVRACDTRRFSEHNVGSKSRNVGTEEKKLIANLRERVEKIGRMTKVLKEQDKGVYRDAEFKGFKHVDDDEDDNIIDQIAGSYRSGNGLNTKKNAQNSNTKKRVCFVEDGNVIKFYDVDGGSRSGSRLVEVFEEANKGSQDEEEVQSDGDGDGSSNSSENMRKCRNVGTDEKKLVANLRERVEKIGRMTKVLEEQDKGVYGDAEFKGFKHVDDDEDDNIIDQIAGCYRSGNRLNTKKNAQNSNTKKQVCFVKDGNVIKFYDIDGGSRSGSRLVEVIEDANKGSQDEEEVPSDGDGEGDQSSNSSENMRKCRSDGNLEEECDNLDEEFTFSNPELAKLDPRADLMARKSGVKIIG